MSPDERDPVLRLVRIAVILAVIGLFFMLVFMIAGFNPWSMGLGVFIGTPLVMLAIAFYLIAAVRDLKRRGVF